MKEYLTINKIEHEHDTYALILKKIDEPTFEKIRDKFLITKLSTQNMVMVGYEDALNIQYTRVTPFIKEWT